GLGRLMMVGNDQRGGLELMDQRVGLAEVPVGIGLVPHAIEPDAADGAVVGKELPQLAVHVDVKVSVPITLIRAVIVPGGAAARVVVRVMPVKLRIIEEELDALTVGFIGEHLERILPVGSALNDVPV